MANNSISSNPSDDGKVIKYGVCLKNHATKFGDYVVDGCLEFVKSGDNGTKEEFICATCECFRGFHRMNNQSFYRDPVIRPPLTLSDCERSSVDESLPSEENKPWESLKKTRYEYELSDQFLFYWHIYKVMLISWSQI